MSKRGQGSGSVRQLQSGRWQARVTDPLTGRQVGIGTHSTRRDAERAIAKVVTEQEAGTWTGAHKITVGQWLDHWLQLPRRDSTQRVYSDSIRRLRPHIERVQLRALTLFHVQRALDANSRLAPHTLGVTRGVLAAAMNDAVRAGLIVRNPVSGTKVPTDARPATERLHMVDYATLLDLAGKCGRYKSMVLFSGLCGARMGECIALRWEKVDLEARTVRLDVAVSTTVSTNVVGPMKTASSRRTVHLPAVVAQALTAERPESGAGLVWPARRDPDLMLNRTAFHRLWSKARKDAGVPTLRFHDLRHTAASLALQGGASLKQVSAMLGHSSIVITADTYGHLAPDDRSAADAIDRLGQA